MRSRYWYTARLITAFAASVVAANVALAQTFPSRNIRIVVATAPSTPPDIISRVVANELQATKGWSVVVENRPGAGQTLGGAEVLRSPADGYTLWGMSMPIAAAPALLSNMSFNLTKDFTPVIKLAVSYNVLVVPPGLQANSVAELIDLLKRNPDKMNYSTGGIGTPAHLIGELFKQKTGVKIAQVPYVQFPQALSDLLNGTNHLMFVTTLPVVDLVASGKLRALAVTAPKRLPSMPSVPTIVEQGHPDLVVEDWTGFAVKAGTPESAVAMLNTAIAEALGKPSVRDAMAKLGAEAAGGTPAEFGALMTSQVEYWGKVIREAGIKPN